MMVKPTTLKRQVERAQLRRGPAWNWKDIPPVVCITIAGLLTIFAPGLMADIGDEVLGSDLVNSSLGVSPSGLLLSMMRLLLVGLIIWMLWHVRQAPLNQRWAWVGVAVGVLMNYSRNVYTGNPATFSFVLLQASLCWLAWRLTTRPTIHQQLEQALARAECAERERDALRGERP